MSKQLSELETLLGRLIVEHEKLLHQIELHHGAMKRLDLKGMEQAGHAQEDTRIRIQTLETRRKLLVAQTAASLRLPAGATLVQLADAAGPMRFKLLALREKLKGAINQVSSRAHIAGRVAGAVLGHLNTAVRLIAGAVEQAGLYTKQGVPKVSTRIGVLEAIG